MRNDKVLKTIFCLSLGLNMGILAHMGTTYLRGQYQEYRVEQAEKQVEVMVKENTILIAKANKAIAEAKELVRQSDAIIAQAK